MLTIAAMVGGCGWAGSVHPAAHGVTGQAVTVCMKFGFDVLPLGRAEELSSEMFGAIGIKIEWSRRDDCHLRGGAIVVTLSYETPASEYEGAYAFAKPYEATHIVVFWDRVQHKVPPPRAPTLLAHVLVHEITHILQGISRHSETGVMKTGWSSDDLYQMGKKPLEFTAEDVRLIHAGIASRSLRMLSLAK
jgi:hypothetical protein